MHICIFLRIILLYHVTRDGGFGRGHSEPLAEDADPVRHAGAVPQQSPGQTDAHRGLCQRNFVTMHMSKPQV